MIAVSDQASDSARRAATIMARLDQLGALSSEPGAITRLFLTPAHKAAAETVLGWMREAGMTAEIDAIGNVVGRYPAAQQGASTLILGSHIDTVRNAGRYDGCLGVAAAIEAVAALRDAGERLPYTIEVIAFGDEEGVRFPEALSSSRAIAGCFDPSVLGLQDQDGITYGAALREFGGDPDGIADLERDPAKLLGFLELHIEQGPVLEAENLPVAIVSAISGATRFRVIVSGQAGHAGTVPMSLRRDAFAATAEMAVSLERLARDTPDVVATIGQVEVGPGAVNVVPGKTVFTVDCRSPDDTCRIEAVAALQASFAAIAARRGVTATFETFYDEASAPCAPALRTSLSHSIANQGLRPFELASGAGHDGLAMQALCPIAMLFIRCAGGVSHNPAESVTEADVAVAVDVLLAFLRNLSPSNG